MRLTRNKTVIAHAYDVNEYRIANVYDSFERLTEVLRALRRKTNKRVSIVTIYCQDTNEYDRYVVRGNRLRKASLV